MILDRFFKDHTFLIDWDYVETIPEFAKLKECEQNPVWHSEGNAWEHTKKCVESVYNKTDFMYAGSEIECKIKVLFVLFHDIGKGVTTEFKNGAWHSYGHEFAGEKIARRLLWNEPIEIRERICACVRYHMIPLHIADSKSCIMDMIKLSRGPFFKWRDVLFVKTCDMDGCITEKPEENAKDYEKLKMLSSLASCMNILDHGFATEGFCTRETEIVDRIYGDKSDWAREQKRQKVYMLIGLPGAGKNTFVDSIEGDYVSVSRDDIRYELGFCGKDEKVVLSSDKENEVSAEFDRRVVEALKSGKDIVINNINLKKQYREATKKLLAGHNVQLIYVIIEAPTIEDNIKRRPTFKPEILRQMCETLDWPRPDECREIYIEKQVQSRD